MNIQVGPLTPKVQSVTIALSLHSAPILHVHLEPHERDHQQEEIFRDAVRKQARVTLGGKVESTLIGYGLQRSRFTDHGSSVVLTSIVLPESVQSWLGEKAKDGSHDLLVYQRQQSESPRQYLERLFDNKIDWAKSELLERDHVFPPGACLWRVEDTTNLRFVSDVTAFLRLRKPSIEGWYCINDASKPMRMATRTEHDIKLGGEWFTPSQLVTNDLLLPHRGLPVDAAGIDKMSLTRNFWLSSERESTKLELIDILSRKGPPNDSVSGLVIEDVGEVFMGPGPASSGRQNYLVNRVQYDFEFQSTSNNSMAATIHLSVWNDGVAASPFHYLRLPAKFERWQSKDNKCLITELRPSGEEGAPAAWSLHGDKKSVYTHVHTPSFVRPNYRGLYSTYVSGDNLFVEIRGGELPVLVGANQQCAVELEKSCMSLHAERIATVTCPTPQPIDKQYGIYIQDEKSLDLRTKTFTVDSKTTEINKNVTITQDKTEIEYDVKAKANVRVLKKLNAGRGMTL